MNGPTAAEKRAGLRHGLTILPAYNRTEVRVIPREWSVKRLADIGRIVRGASPRPAGDPKYFNGTFIPWLTVAAVTNIPDWTLRVTETLGFLTQDGANLSRTLEQGTVIIANSGATLGVAKILGIKSCANDGIAAIVNQREGDKRFVCYCLNSLTGYLRKVVATGNGQPNLNTALIGNITIPIPPAPEQRAIAAALSDVDAQIGTLDKLIAKKRAIKLAAMQLLLTGTRRLPRFDRGWDIKRIGEFTDCTAGGTPSTSIPAYWGGSNRWMSSGELNLKIVAEVEGRITDQGLRNSSAKMLPANCVLIGLAGQGKTRGTVAINKVPLSTNQSIAAVYPNSSFCSEYLYYNLDMRYDELRGMSTGEGGRGGLNLKVIGSIPVPFPELQEQCAIASALSDMDTEIAALEQRREKTKAIKQGMMQALLTGRVRLVNREASA
jgi:type I restriction enzyme, S subunit